MKKKTYWFITGIHCCSPESWRDRCWGFLDNFKEAEEAVINNAGDIYDSDYEWMVIEEHYMDVPSQSTGKIKWYKYNDETEKYGLVDDKPDMNFAGNLLNWGIG